LKEKIFRKESDPRYGTELHQVELNNHDGVYIVDGVPHSRKDLQSIRGRVVIPSKKLTATQIKEDKIGKAAYNPVVKDLMGSRPTLEQVDTMINEPRKQRGKQIDVLAMLNKKFKTPAPGLTSTREQTKK
jgi:hypothetical protein